MFGHLSILTAAGLAMSACATLAEPTKSPVKPKPTTELRADGAGMKGVASKSSGAVRTVSGAIDRSDPRLADGSHFDQHTLTLNAGDRVTVTMRSATLDPYLLLARDTGRGLEEVAQDDDGAGSGLNARITTTVTQGGSYVLIANTAMEGQFGRYELSIEVEPAGGFAPSVTEQISSDASVTTGGTYSGSLMSGREPLLADGTLAGVVTYNGRRGELVEIAMASREVDPYLLLTVVRDGQVEVIAEDDDSGPGTDSLIRLHLPYDGQYQIVANTATFGQGRYEVSVRGVAPVTAGTTFTDPAARFPGGGDSDGRYALLVGIDDYPGKDSDLSSCITDVREIRRVLIEQMGFPEANVVVLTDAQATRENIIEATRRHLGQAGPDGAAVFYFSGHGAQLDGNYGQKDNEPDGRDEAICCWGPSSLGSLLLDEELGGLVGELRARHRVVILDSCHAGTGTLGGQVKALSYDDPAVKASFPAPESPLAFKTTAPGDLLDGPGDHLLFAACAPHQLASAGNNGSPSVFTAFLVREIGRRGATQSADELMSRVRDAISRYYLETLNRDDAQTPQLEGPDKGRPLIAVFGGRE